MANLKDIKNRISSINSTQKITRAMKMVAAAKVKKSENMVKSGRPFASSLAQMFSKIFTTFANYSVEELKVSKSIDNYPALLAKRELKVAGYLLITSNKGLAGAYNANLVRYFLKRAKENSEKGIKTKVFVVGQKGLSQLTRKTEAYGFEIAKTYTTFPQIPTSTDSSIVANDLADAFVGLEIDSIEVVTTQFKNMMSYSVGCWKLLPIDTTMDIHDNHIESEMLFEPNEDAILQKIVPMYLTNLLYHAFLEATASELASRMTAMSAATSNAQDMIKDLTVVYNKLRQTAITQEISEVVSGADALKH